MPDRLWTIGHSTRPIDEFLTLLKVYGIRQLVDVRTVPRSRHNPQFIREALALSLATADVNYQHSSQLGGLRKPRRDSINLGWRNASFRGYADYMQTDEFWSALEELTAYSRKQKTAIMCAEAVPWRCHRSLIADALLANQWEVYHILSGADAKPHQLTSFARIIDKQLWYPEPDEPSSVPNLF